MTPRRILVIDDSPTVRERVKTALSAREYEVRAASGPWEGLAEIRIAPPDLILLDLMMPAINGVALAAKIREEGCQAPIVILTEASRSAAEQARIRVQAAASLDKSCSDALLRMTVATALLFTIGGALRRR